VFLRVSGRKHTGGNKYRLLNDHPSTMLRAGIGNYYERDNRTTVRKYYYAGGVRVATRTGGQTYYLIADHLTSTAITTSSNGVQLTELR
jgi:hypothetical protein